MPTKGAKAAYYICGEKTMLDIYDLSVEDTKEYFEIYKAIEILEKSKQKEVDKIRLLFHEFKNHYKALKGGVEGGLIRGRKWDGGKYIITNMEEEEFKRQTVEMDERGDSEECIKNFLALSVNQKERLRHIKGYEILYDYVLVLLDKIMTNPQIARLHEDKLRSDELIEVVGQLEGENMKLREEIERITGKIESFKTDVLDTLLEAQKLKLMGAIYTENLEDEKLIRLLVLVQNKQPCKAKELSPIMNISPTLILKHCQNYREYFKIDEDGTISIRWENIAPQAKEGAQEAVKALEDVAPMKEKILSHISSIVEKIKGIKLSRKKEGKP